METLGFILLFIIQMLGLYGIAILARKISNKLKQKWNMVDSVDDRLTKAYNSPQLETSCAVFVIVGFLGWVLPNMIEGDYYQLATILRLTGTATLIYIAGRIIYYKLIK